MQAIRTRFCPATNRKGARMAADCVGGRISISYDYELSDVGNHKAAVRALCIRMGWDQLGPLVGGSTKEGMVWVFAIGSYSTDE